MDCGDVNDSFRLEAVQQPKNETYNFDKAIYTAIYHWFYRFGLPAVCMCGFLGNVLNLIILTGKGIQRALRMTERSANTGLVALATSDLMFCALAFPSTFLPENQRYSSRGFLLYYGLYCAALINVFIMYSTWLTVVMATERYLAICFPLKARKILSVHRSRVAIILTFCFSVATNIPVFWRYTYKVHHCANETFYSLIMVELFDSASFDHAYRTIWATIGNFIPLVLLVFFNYCLIREIHRSYAQRKEFAKSSFRGHADTETNHRVTMTLISIVVMFLVLVAPSEVVKHIAKLANKNIEENYTYLTIEVITNVMQTINFSANFILYCCINPSFRRTMRHMFCSHCMRRAQEREVSRYETCLTGTPDVVRKRQSNAHNALSAPVNSETNNTTPAHRESIVLCQDVGLLNNDNHHHHRDAV